MTEPTNLSHDLPDVQEHLENVAAQLASLDEQVRRLQQLAGLGTMSAMLAHEINNLLTPIVSYCQYAASRNDPELLRAAVEKSLTGARRISSLCTRALGLVSERKSTAAMTPIVPLVVDVLDSLGRDLEKDNISTRVDIPISLHAFIDAEAIRHVLLNLVLNARQAMLDRRGTLTISAVVAEGQVSITVADTGPGIAPEHLPRLFEPFFTTKGQEQRTDRGGAGLGLTVCQRLLADCGGTIQVKSQFGSGAAFTISLPAAAPVQP
jgi:signal transduction histidine kinase